MGNRGRKPVKIRELDVWEFEWYKAFHLLRDGVQLPPPQQYVRPELVHLTPKEIDERIERLKKLTPEELLAAKEREARKPLRPTSVWLFWAQSEIDRQVAELKSLKPREIHKRAERRDIWNALIWARTLPALQKACQRWGEFPDVRGMGFSCFPAHVLANHRQFLSMKRNRRFPRSDYADESRLEYLARGMAGVMVGISPMTAIERLRNMKHGPGGRLWNEAERQCECWRCGIARDEEIRKELAKDFGFVELPKGGKKK